MNDKSLIIIGNGGHARVLIDILEMQGQTIIGYTAPVEEKNNYGLTYIGTDEEVFSYDPHEVLLVNAIGSIAKTDQRTKIYQLFKSKGYSFSTVIHPKAIISSTAILSEGVQIMAGAVIQPFVKIGENAIINTAVTIDHDCFIGNHCHIAPGSVLSGGVKINEETHIGTGCTVIQNIHIGKRVLVGAGSLVLNHILDYQTAYGSPAKEVKR
jgi:sugar O-acyltransferase (sialic acid O-acetyltransferase NeuD family)